MRGYRGRSCLAAFATAVVATLAALVAAQAATASTITLTPVAIGFNNPIGVDYYEPTNSVLLTTNYPSGFPFNFELVASDGTRTQYSSVAGLTDEIYPATIRSSSCQGGFTVGDAFVGTGVPGAVAKISAGGAVVQNPWVTLPGETSLLRGGLFQDRYCAFGGDLIATTENGDVWRIDSAGTPTFVGRGGAFMEGPTTVPNDPRYGPWAGTVVATDESSGRVWSVAPDGTATSWFFGEAPESIRVIPANENFYGVDFAGVTLWTAPPSEFTGMVGDILLANENGTLDHVTWNGTSFVKDQIAQVAQWEGTAFAPARLPTHQADVSITKDAPATVTEGGNLTYTLTVTNAGPGSASNVTVTDTLPSGETFVSASPDCSASGSTVTCTIASLASGGSATETITASVATGTAGPLVNTASVTADEPDPDTSNNSATASTTVNHVPSCAAAVAGAGLWPPSHALVPVTITVTDPDGNAVTVTPTSVTQDEPQLSPGSGNFAPDATLSPLTVRAEREGGSNGRVYQIGFTASDGVGGTCSGTVMLGVPHDMGAGSTAVAGPGPFVSSL